MERATSKEALKQLNETITKLRSDTEKLKYLNEATLNEADDKKQIGVEMGDVPFLVIGDYISRYDDHIRALEGISRTLKESKISC